MKMSKVKVEINGVDYSLRTSLTLEDYYKYNDLIFRDTQSKFIITSELLGCTEETLRTLSPDEWEELWILVDSTIHPSVSLLASASPIVEVEGVKYGLINLDHMTIGEFSDIDVILAKPTPELFAHEVLAILYRPIKWQLANKYKLEPYDVETYRDRAETFKKFPMLEGRTALNFFLTSGRGSLRDILHSLKKKETTKDQLSLINKLLRTGISLSMGQQMEMLQKYRKSLNSLLGLSSTTSQLRKTRSRKLKLKLEKEV